MRRRPPKPSSSARARSRRARSTSSPVTGSRSPGWFRPISVLARSIAPRCASAAGRDTIDEQNDQPVRSQPGFLPLQAIAGFFSAVTRKGIKPRDRAAALAGHWLDVFPHATAPAHAVRTALADAVAGRASYWDALLPATAAEAGCRLTLTEDLAHG